MDQKLTLDQINNLYRDLCAELGHLTLGYENTVARIKAIKSEIQGLDARAAGIKQAQEAEAKNAAKAQPELKAVVEQSEEVIP